MSTTATLATLDPFQNGTARTMPLHVAGAATAWLRHAFAAPERTSKGGYGWRFPTLRGATVKAPRQSGNTKVGPMAATYAPIAVSCSTACKLHPVHGGLCYADGGKVKMATRDDVDRTPSKVRPLDVARAEGAALFLAFRHSLQRGRGIPHLSGAPRILRLHVSGDARTPAAARTLGLVASWWRAEGGGEVYTYTHAWRDVARGQWGPDVSVLASLDHEREAPQARARGYRVHADVVATHGSARATRGQVPCPNQTRGVLCAKCGLCMLEREVFAGTRAASFDRVRFAAHGMREGELKRRLTVVAA